MNPEHLRCERCRLKQPHCICSAIPRVETRTRLLIVRHVYESRRRSNTARLAGLALPACEIVDYGGVAIDRTPPPGGASAQLGDLRDPRSTAFTQVGDPGEPRRSASAPGERLASSVDSSAPRRDRPESLPAFSDPRLEMPDTWLLYPGAPFPDPDSPRPAQLVVLDGSWRQARRMFLRVTALQRLPRLSLPPPAEPPVHRLRRAAPAHAMATLEAIAHALAWLEGADVARPLHALFALFVERSILSSDQARRWRGNV